MHIDVSVEGLGAIEAALTEIPDNMMDGARQGTLKGLEMVVRDAKKLCPANTGELRNSIRAKVQGGAGGIVGVVFPARYYGAYVEMGTGDVGRKSGGNGSGVKVSYRTGGWFAPVLRGEKMMGDTVVEGKSNGFWTYGQPARPFLYPAFKANKQRVLACIRDAIREAL